MGDAQEGQPEGAAQGARDDRGGGRAAVQRRLRGGVRPRRCRTGSCGARRGLVRSGWSPGSRPGSAGSAEVGVRVRVGAHAQPSHPTKDHRDHRHGDHGDDQAEQGRGSGRRGGRRRDAWPVRSAPQWFTARSGSTARRPRRAAPARGHPPKAPAQVGRELGSTAKPPPIGAKAVRSRAGRGALVRQGEPVVGVLPSRRISSGREPEPGVPHCRSVTRGPIGRSRNACGGTARGFVGVRVARSVSSWVGGRAGGCPSSGTARKSVGHRSAGDVLTRQPPRSEPPDTPLHAARGSPSDPPRVRVVVSSCRGSPSRRCG